MGQATVVQINDPSRVAQVRRLARSTAELEGLDEKSISDCAIVATELATNLAKHAQKGEIHVLPLSTRGPSGVEIVSIDSGPGMANPQQHFADGYSTAGTSGTGLGAIQRLSSQFDIYSLPGRGTVISARIFAPAVGAAATGVQAAGATKFAIGVAAKPVSGETISGDSWSVRFANGDLVVMIADGLGHGAQAGEASSEAVACFEKLNETSPVEMLQRVHGALRGTRGAAVSIARIEFAGNRVLFAGLGNVAGVIVNPSQDPPRLQAMVSHNGTAGYEARHMKEFSYALAATDTVILHSDGLASHWNLPAHPGLLRKHPSIIAATLYKEYARQRDDVCVVVVGKQVDR